MLNQRLPFTPLGFFSSCLPPKQRFFSPFFSSSSSAPHHPSQLLSWHSALIAEGHKVTSGPCEGQVIQGHWRVISSDWLTSKRTSGRSQSALSLPPAPFRQPTPRRILPPAPPSFHLLQLISSLCHMTRARRQREDD